MGLIKKSEATTVDTATTVVVDNLVSKFDGLAPIHEKASKSGGRDFDAEAAGKIAHGCYTAAIQSPALQMFAGQTPAEFFDNVKIVAELAIKEVMRHQRTKEMFK